jgi:hypothetical protein
MLESGPWAEGNWVRKPVLGFEEKLTRLLGGGFVKFIHILRRKSEVRN